MSKIIDLIKEKYLSNDNDSIDKNKLIESLNKTLDISIEKIKIRIEKLIEKGDLELLKNNSIILSIKFDEQEKVGDFILGRKGRGVYIKNTSDKKHSKSEQEQISKMAKSDLEKTLNDLEIKILETDPLKVLTFFSRKIGTKDIDEIGKDTQELQISLEIIQKIILKHKKEDFRFNPDFDINKISLLIKDLKTKVLNYCMFYEMVDVADNYEEKQSLMLLRSHYLITRGEAYPVHYEYVYKQMFQHLNSCFDIDIIKFYEQMKEIEKQIDSNIQNPFPSKQIILDKMKIYLEDEKDFKKAREKCKQDNPLLFKKSFNEIFNIENMYKLDKTKFDKTFLNLLSLEFGENSEWKNVFDFDKILTKPLIKYEEEYYCFIPQHILRNKKLILESIVPIKNQQKYKKLKGEFFESETRKAFEKILKSKESYVNLYTKEKNSSEKDLIIIKDDAIFIIEIKGTKRRLFSSDLNIIEQTKEDFKVSIKKAFEQVNDTYDYILKEDEAIFYDSNNKKQRKDVLRLKKADYNKFFKICVHSDSFGALSSCLDNIKSIDQEFYKNSKDFWTLNLYDLLIFKDIIETPDDFLEYLEQRLGLNSNKNIVAQDEIDLLGYFLNEGSLKLSEDITKGSILSVFSEEIDKYFESLSIEGIEIEKPKRKK